MHRSIKINIIIICAIISIGILFIVVYNRTGNINENIAVGVTDVSIENISDSDNYNILFDLYGWPDKLLNEIDENMDSYVIVSVNYVVNNNSSEVVMKDVHFYPKFTDEIDPMVKAYNSGNDTYYLNAQPQYGTGLRQYFIIDKNGKTNDEILSIILDQSIELVYFTRELMDNTGHGYRGIGKQKYEFVINVAAQYYNLNSELFN